MFGRGVPALRHDWLFPIDTSAFIQRMSDLGTGWSPGGLGQPNPNPMTYLVVWPLALVAAIAGAPAALALLGASVVAAIVYAGLRVARRAEVSGVGAIALVAFLLFNPWTYNKVVAGHLTQIIAYAGLALCLNELIEKDPDSRRLSLSVILTALQTQFWCIAIVLCALRLRLRAARTSIVVGAIVFLPSIIGIALDRSSLLSLPFTIPWENTQSVPLRDGALLEGYFPHYADQAYSGAGSFAIGAFCLLALIAPLTWRRRTPLALAALAALTLIAASGTTGWLAVAWRWAIVRAPVVGVYRELYDLIALVAVCYALLSAMSIAKIPPLRWVALASAAALAIVWFRSPPADRWVAAQSLPRASAVGQQSGRYALMPPFQPLSYLGRGSGADPLYVARTLGDAPVNDLLTFFPANAALATYWFFGDAWELSRLGVGVIDCRPGFAEAEDALTYYGSAAAKHAPAACNSQTVRIAGPAPIVSLAAKADRCSLCSLPAAGDLFIGDTPSGGSSDRAGSGAWFRAAPAAREFVRPQDGWIDARLIFPSKPWLAQPLGGAYTTQSAAPLIVGVAPYILADIHGSLVDDRARVLTASTQGYRWIELPPGVDRVSCRGECLIAGAGDPHGVPLDAPPVAAQPLSSGAVTPWLVSVMLPAGSTGVMRYIETFDQGWIAVRTPGFALLQHIRTDASLNGWFVPLDDRPSHVWLVHATSVAQLVAEVIGFCCALVVLMRRAPFERRTLESG